MNAPLFEIAEREIADTSLEAFERILPTLAERELAVFVKVCEYLDATGYQDVTGGELADWCGMDKTSIRPRLTGLEREWKVLVKRPTRSSRAPLEGRCHPYVPCVPRAAMQRAQKQLYRMQFNSRKRQ